jgi:hypothetical protein
MISGHSRRAGFRADPLKSPYFIRFSTIYGPFGTPIFKWIFPSFSGADSLEGDFDESGNPDHGMGYMVT